jgi:hypothetical protein
LKSKLPRTRINRSAGVAVRQPPAATSNVSPWTAIEPGRFMPLRTRGSFPGRELG